MKKIYGYCRISTKKQDIERQERNILAEYQAKRYKYTTLKYFHKELGIGE